MALFRMYADAKEEVYGEEYKESYHIVNNRGTVIATIENLLFENGFFEDDEFENDGGF